MLQAAAAVADMLAPTAPKAADAAVAAACHTCGISCIRVQKSHVLTMLLLAWAAPPPGAAAAATALARLPPRAAALVRAVGDVLDTAPESVRHESRLLQAQLRASVALLCP
jgi:hypothetical protein